MRGTIVWTAAVLLCAATVHAAEPPKIAAIGDLPLERDAQSDRCSDEGSGVRRASTLPIGIAAELQPGCGCSKTGDWMTAPRIAEDSIG